MSQDKDQKDKKSKWTTEVKKPHEWRCDGPCRNLKPDFGYIRRKINRAPGPHDGKRDEYHRQFCGGRYWKQEPIIPGKGVRNGPNTKITDYYPVIKKQQGTRSDR